MKKITICITVLVSLLFVFFFVGSSFAVEPEYVIKYGSPNPPREWSQGTTMFKVFKAEAEARSNGRLKIEFGGPELGNVASQVNQLKMGIIQMGGNLISTIAPEYPEIQVFSIPYLFADRTVAWKVLDGPIGQKLMEETTKATGVRPLYWSENGGYRHFSNSVRPIHSPADMKGLKIRTMNSPIDMETVKALGANPTPIAWSELYISLQTGVVDGQENAIETFRIPKLEEVQKYIVLDGHTYSIGGQLSINEEFYQSLPDDLKRVIHEAATLAKTVNRAMCVATEVTGIEYLLGKGIEIYKPTKAEMAMFREAQAPAIKYLKERIDPKLVDEILEASAQAAEELGF